MKLSQRIKQVKDSELKWDWDSSNPSYHAQTPNSKYGGSYTKFDPFPCYAHKKEVILKHAEMAEKTFPIGFETFYFLFPYEPIGRTNGQAQTNTVDYSDIEKGKRGSWEGIIELYGKRIPIMPTMSNYLTFHEYSHHIDSWICNCRCLEQNGLDAEYAKLRDIKLNTKYGGRNWHTNIGEIIANDCRICVFDSQAEFWPHEVEHPYKSPKVIKFWREMVKKYSHK